MDIDTKIMCGAVLTYEECTQGIEFNVGDYIQSIAALQFFSNKDKITYIEREALNLYDGASCKLIMNGWFMHNPNNWPPGKNIHPLFISFHLNDSVKDTLMTPGNIAYLKQHEPIGCRDQTTYKLLQENNIEAYFSGCLTLTLGQTYSRSEVTEDIYIIDPLVFHYTSEKPSLTNILYYLMYFVLNKNILKQLHIKLHVKSRNTIKENLKMWIRTIRFYKTYSNFVSDEVLVKAKYLTHMLSNEKYKTRESRFREADRLLQSYSKAKYIITSRIHVALPCISMNVPVIYVINNDENKTSHCRFHGITSLFHCVHVSILKSIVLKNDLGEKIGIDTQFYNKEVPKQLLNNLVERCRKFTNSL